MFRKMRRFKQQLSQEETENILKNGTTAVLSVIGDMDYPYSVPINYVYADGKIYFHGANEGHKYDALCQNEKVSLCVIAQDQVLPETLSTSYKSVIIFGRARILKSEEEIIHAARVFGLRYNPDKAFIDSEIAKYRQRLSCIEVIIEHMTGKQSLNFISGT